MIRDEVHLRNRRMADTTDAEEHEIKQSRKSYEKQPDRRFRENAGTGLVLAGVHRRLDFHEMQSYVRGMHRRSLFIPVIALPMPKDGRTTAAGDGVTSLWENPLDILYHYAHKRRWWTFVDEWRR